MTETMIGTIAFIQCILICVGSYLYMLGGRKGKWKRRFIGSLIVATSVWVGLLLMGHFRWLHTLLYPLLIGGFVLGYGGSDIMTKLIRRTIIVGAIGVAGLLLCLTLSGKAWWILPIQIFVSIPSIYFAWKNPVHAAAEEFLVCLLLTLILPFYAMVAQLP